MYVYSSIYLLDWYSCYSLLLFFIWRCEVGTDSWVQCNDRPVKICKYPVTGLFEGKSYIFRVRAVNSVGISRPSRVSEAVVALDPLDLKPLQGRARRLQVPAVLCDLFFLFPPRLVAEPWEHLQSWAQHSCASWAPGGRQGHVRGGDARLTFTPWNEGASSS